MEEIDLKEVFQIFIEKKLKIIFITMLFILAGIIYSLFIVIPKYESSTTLLLSTNANSKSYEKNDSLIAQEGITTTDITINSKLVSTYSVLVKSDRIIRKVISNLKLDETEEEIRKNVTVTAVSDTEVIKISVQNYNPVTSAKIANEIASVFTETIKEFFGIENIHIVDYAETSDEPCNVNHIKDVAIFMFIGLVISAFYIFVLTLVDTRIKSTEEIERKMGLTVLATIPIYEENEERKERRKK